MQLGTTKTHIAVYMHAEHKKNKTPKHEQSDLQGSKILSLNYCYCFSPLLLMAYKITENNVNDMIPYEQNVGDTGEEKVLLTEGDEADI